MAESGGGEFEWGKRKLVKKRGRRRWWIEIESEDFDGFAE